MSTLVSDPQSGARPLSSGAGSPPPRTWLKRTWTLRDTPRSAPEDSPVVLAQWVRNQLNKVDVHVLLVADRRRDRGPPVHSLPLLLFGYHVPMATPACRPRDPRVVSTLVYCPVPGTLATGVNLHFPTSQTRSTPFLYLLPLRVRRTLSGPRLLLSRAPTLGQRHGRGLGPVTVVVTGEKRTVGSDGNREGPILGRRQVGGDVDGDPYSSGPGNL